MQVNLENLKKKIYARALLVMLGFCSVHAKASTAYYCLAPPFFFINLAARSCTEVLLTAVIPPCYARDQGWFLQHSRAQ